MFVVVWLFERNGDRFAIHRPIETSGDEHRLARRHTAQLDAGRYTVPPCRPPTEMQKRR